MLHDQEVEDEPTFRYFSTLQYGKKENIPLSFEGIEPTITHLCCVDFHHKSYHVVMQLLLLHDDSMTGSFVSYKFLLMLSISLSNGCCSSGAAVGDHAALQHNGQYVIRQVNNSLIKSSQY